MDWNPTHPADQLRYTPAQVFSAGLFQHHIANTAYPIAHLVTMRPYQVPRSQIQHIATQAWQEISRLGLYVHVPFCELRCGFCEYTVINPAENQASEDLYFDLLLHEIELYRQAMDTPAKTLIGFDIGGGTPSVAKTKNLTRLLDAVRCNFSLPDTVAISIETTPKIAATHLEKIQAYHDLGIRRISMGVQTINARLLQEVGRSATSVEFNRRATAHIRQAGFERFNVDVMYGFARQSLQSLEATLNHVISLKPEYITLYRTRYKGTRIVVQAEQVTLTEVNAQSKLAKEILLGAGYYASPGKNTFSRLPGDVGTSDYLTERVIYGTPYLGLGLGAQSLSQYTLAYNSGAADKRLTHYARQIQAGELPIQDLYHLSIEAAMAKMIAVSFYFGEIHLPAFKMKFGISLEQAFPDEIEYLRQNNLMEITCDKDDEQLTLRLTEEGVDVLNGVVAQFYAGAVKRHLIDLTIAQADSPGQFIVPMFSGEKIHV